jgi:hypothetical protein
MSVGPASARTNDGSAARTQTSHEISSDWFSRNPRQPATQGLGDEPPRGAYGFTCAAAISLARSAAAAARSSAPAERSAAWADLLADWFDFLARMVATTARGNRY